MAAFYNGDAFTNSPAGQLPTNATGEVGRMVEVMYDRDDENFTHRIKIESM